MNNISIGSWVGGIEGLTSILEINSQKKALSIMETLVNLGYIEYDIDKSTQRLTYKITDWVVECSEASCSEEAVYAKEGQGFLCLPRSITQRLVEKKYTFEPADAWLDLWCHSVWQDSSNAFSQLSPIVQFSVYKSALTLKSIGERWNWDKKEVWQFLKSNADVFLSYKLPGSYGCLIFNISYPTDSKKRPPTSNKIKRILEEIRIKGQNTHVRKSDDDNLRINKLIAWYSKFIVPQDLPDGSDKTCSDPNSCLEHDSSSIRGPCASTPP